MSLTLVLKPVLSLRASFCLALEQTMQPVYLKYFKPGINIWGHSNKTLATFPCGTLGHDMYLFLSKNGLELMPKAEDHDVFHVLFEFEATVPGEILLQALLLGNGRRTPYVWAAVLLGWLLYPELHPELYRCYRRGKSYRPCHRWNFQYLLMEPTRQLRAFVTNSDISPEFCTH